MKKHSEVKGTFWLTCHLLPGKSQTRLNRWQLPCLCIFRLPFYRILYCQTYSP